MKVNEVIIEGWRDYIPKFVPARELEAQKKAKVTKLKKGSSDELKKEAAKVLGVKEKKKGRPKKE